MKSEKIETISADPSGYRAFCLACRASFEEKFGKEGDIRVVSAPGRTEISGNHTDHNGGRVIAAAVEPDAVAVCRKRDDSLVRLFSEHFGEISLELSSLAPVEKEKYTSASLIRGVAASLAEKGRIIGGFDAFLSSRVQTGSGLSSSAAFECCIAAVFDRLYNGGALTPLEAALAGQKAENAYFGKPSGLMDQTASAFGGFVTIDFRSPTNPVIESLPIDVMRGGFSTVIVNCRSSHGGLTDAYAAIPSEMKAAAAICGKTRLADLSEEELIAAIPAIRRSEGDRAVLRSLHFFEENRRVAKQVDAIRRGDVLSFLRLVRESGNSSAAFLQNLYVNVRPRQQSLPVALALSSTFGDDVFARVHGGGFAGTILAFVKNEVCDAYLAALDGVFGEGSCKKTAIRPVGACEVLLA